MTRIPFHPKPCDARKDFSKLWVPLPLTTRRIVRRLDVLQLSSWAIVRVVILNTPDVRARAARNDKLRYTNRVTSINYDFNFSLQFQFLFLSLYLLIIFIVYFKDLNIYLLGKNKEIKESRKGPHKVIRI